MKDGDEQCYCRGMPRMVVRIAISAVMLIVVITIVLAVLRGILGSSFFGGALPGWVWNIIGLIVALWLVSWFLRMVFRPWGRHGSYWMRDEQREMRILRRRYARGEISEAQFKKMMKNLKEWE